MKKSRHFRFWVRVLVWTQTQIQKEINLGLDSEFIGIDIGIKHFGIEINKCFKFLRPKKFLGLKKILKKFFQKLQICLKFLDLNIFLGLNFRPKKFKIFETLKNFEHLLILAGGRNFGLGLGGFWVWTQTQNPSFFLGLINSEFNSIHIGVEFKKKILLVPKIVWV